MKLLSMLPVALAIQKRYTEEQMEEALPSSFWEPSATGMSTTAATIGDSVSAFIVNSEEILNHGCHCSKFHDRNHDVNEVFMDPIDFACKKWRAARNCIHLPNGPCHNQRGVTYTIENGICLDARDSCAGAACMIDLFHQRIMNMEIIYKRTFEQKSCDASGSFDMDFGADFLMKSLTEANEGPTRNEETQRSGGNIDPVTAAMNKNMERDFHQCCGIAPRFQKYNTQEEVCSNDGTVRSIDDSVEEEKSENYYKVAEEVAQASAHESQNEASFETIGDNDFAGFD
jgi:hypothetical protein